MEISLEQRKCRDLITLNTLHLYYGGPKPMSVACKLNAYSRHCKYFLIFPSSLHSFSFWLSLVYTRSLPL